MNHPFLYEVNTRCWLRERELQIHERTTLATIPDEEIDQWQRLGFTHIWLMGVWKVGKGSRELALTSPELRRRYDALLPRWQVNDIPGSPYAIYDYSVNVHLGGASALRQFRRRLHERGMKLILDFVPNHLDKGHLWTSEHPELLVQGKRGDPGVFRKRTHHGIRWLAYGKDPYFAPWVDTVQLDYRNPAAHARMIDVLQQIAGLCDGVRCDMAMLLLNDVFENTWKDFPSGFQSPPGEFWENAIASVKCDHPGFLFLAEAYWDLEKRLQQLGFDFTYDKRLYDELVHKHGSEAAARVAGSTVEFLSRSAHFLENHDEPRVAATLALEEHRAAALVTLALPGMRLLHEGQLTGSKIQVPVQMARRPVEPLELAIAEFYQTLLTQLKSTSIGNGTPIVLVPGPAWESNPTAQNFVLIQWQTSTNEFDLVVVNLASHQSQCYAPLEVEGLGAHDWDLRDLLGSEKYSRNGQELAKRGLYLDVPAYAAQIFRFEEACTEAGT